MSKKQKFDDVARIEYAKDMAKLAAPHLEFVQNLAKEVKADAAYFLEYPNLHTTFVPRLQVAQIMIAHAHHAAEQAGGIFLGTQYHKWDHGPNDGIPFRDSDIPF